MKLIDSPAVSRLGDAISSERAGEGMSCFDQRVSGFVLRHAHLSEAVLRSHAVVYIPEAEISSNMDDQKFRPTWSFGLRILEQVTCQHFLALSPGRGLGSVGRWVFTFLCTWEYISNGRY